MYGVGVRVGVGSLGGRVESGQDQRPRACSGFSVSVLGDDSVSV